MKRIVPESKFRHLRGVPSSKDQVYDGISATETRLESNIVTVNRKFIAVALLTSGAGNFTVLRRDKPGRIERIFRCIGHSSEVLDLSFDRFNPNRIVSGSEDGMYLVWWIPDEGLTADLEKVQCQLRQSQRRVVQSEWHPSVVDILIGINIDSINIFNVATAETLSTINTSLDNDQIWSASLNFNASSVAVSFKDKFVRIYDLNTLQKLSEFPAHVGSKPIKLAWITEAFDDDLLVTTGSTKSSEREISLWKISDPSAPLSTENMDHATSAYNVYYDSDTRVLAFNGRGESSIKFFELMSDPGPILYQLTTHTGGDAQRAVGFGNKLSCNFASNEIMHAVRVINKGVEEVSFIVPRKSDLWQDDLFPDSVGEVPALTAQDYMEGKRADPIKVSLKNYLPETATLTVNVRPVSTVQAQPDRSAKSSFTSISQAINVPDELSAMKASLQALEDRVRALEEKDQC